METKGFSSLPASLIYHSSSEGFFEIGNGTSSFCTGMALLAWRETEDQCFLNQVLRLATFYREQVFTQIQDTHHDLGFLDSRYSVALGKLTGDPAHRETGLRAAEVLSWRFHPGRGPTTKGEGWSASDAGAARGKTDCVALKFIQ